MSDQNEHTPSDEFQRAAQQKRVGLVRDFLDFLKYNKKWWLLPILFTFGILGALVLLQATGVGPFMYTLF